MDDGKMPRRRPGGVGRVWTFNQEEEHLADSSEEELVQVRVDDSLLRAVGIGVGLADVGRLRAVVTRVPEAVLVGVGLVGVGKLGAVVAGIWDAIGVSVIRDHVIITAVAGAVVVDDPEEPSVV
mgnify:CR=1 FL=1